MKEDNLFATEEDVISFLNSPRARGDFGVESLLKFPYATDQTRALACAHITTYLEKCLRSRSPLEPLGREIQIIAPFLEAAGYTPALEPLTTLRNKLEARDDYGVPTASGKYESTVAVRHAIETLRRLRNSPAEIPRTPPVPSETLVAAGRVFDARLLIEEMVTTASREIVVIDSYVGTETLVLLSQKQRQVSARVVTKNLNQALRSAVVAFNRQYGGLSVKTSDVFHDRFVIIDGTDFYHIGASIEHLGRRTFMVSTIEDPEVRTALWSQYLEAWDAAAEAL